MPTRRMIDPSFWKSESLATISREDRFFFIGLISNADDQGRLRAHPAILRAEIYPFEDIDFAEIDRQIEVLCAIDCIHCYEADGKKLIQIVNWWKYQTPQWAYPSKLPPPDGWQDRLRYRENNKVKTANWNDSGGGFSGGNNSNNDYANLPKALPKPLPKPIEIGIELELETDKDYLASPPRSKKMPEIIPAFQVFTEVAKTHGLTKMQREVIAKEVGEDPGDLERWRSVVKTWCLRGYKPINAEGMLDWFKNGIPKKGQNNGQSIKRGNPQTPGRRTAQPRPDSTEAIKREIARLEREIANGGNLSPPA